MGLRMRTRKRKRKVPRIESPLVATCKERHEASTERASMCLLSGGYALRRILKIGVNYVQGRRANLV